MKKHINIKHLLSCFYLITTLFTVLLSGCSSDNTILSPAQQAKPSAEHLLVSPYQNTALMADAQVLFNREVNLLTGWNHVPSYPNEFTRLSFPHEFYQVSSTHQSVNYPFSVTLIKKYHNWHHQHANGITAKFPQLVYGGVAGIELVLRINRERSHLPDLQQLAKIYQPWLDNEQLARLDDGNVHLSLSLRSAEKAQSPRFNAEYFLTLNVNSQLDAWYHVFIPITEFIQYNEINYQKTGLSKEQANPMVVADFKLSAETQGGKVLRHFISDNYNEQVPAVFKEIGLEIQYLAIVNKHHL
ncbi:hypothetical protein [Thalassotalea agariperforans]